MDTQSIMIVDDAAETRLFLKGLVTSLGYTSYEAKSGLDALKILNDHKIDLVILDVLMPNMDGYQTLEYINKLKPTQNIKVVFLTGKKGELDQDKMMQLKPDDIIHKSVDIQVLKNKLKKLVGADGHSASKSPVTGQTTTASGNTGTTPKSDELTVDLAATITNMPMVIEIKVTKISNTAMTFKSPFQVKEGSLLSIDCPIASNALKKTGDLQVKVKACVAENDKIFTVTAEIA